MPLARSCYPSSPPDVLLNSLFFCRFKRPAFGRPTLISGLITTAPTAEKDGVLSAEKNQGCVHEEKKKKVLHSLTVKIWTFADTSLRRLLFWDTQFCRSLPASVKASLCRFPTVTWSTQRLGAPLLPIAVGCGARSPCSRQHGDRNSPPSPSRYWCPWRQNTYSVCSQDLYRS